MGGGGDYHPIKIDPAIERWSEMHSTMYKRFKFTRQNMRPIIGLAFVFPAIVYGVAYYSDGIFDMRGTLRDEPFVMTPGSKHNPKAAALDKEARRERLQKQSEE